MQKTTYVFFRHGKSIASYLNPPKRQNDWDRLSPKGESQMKILGDEFGKEGRPLDVFLSSPLIRAMESADFLATRYSGFPLPVTVVEELREFRRPELVYGLPLTDFAHTLYKASLKQSVLDLNENWRFEDQTDVWELFLKQLGLPPDHKPAWISESWADLLIMKQSLIPRLYEEYEGKTIGIMGHSNSLAAMVTILLMGDMPLKQLFVRSLGFYLKHGGMAIIQGTPDRWMLCKFDKHERT